MGFSSGQDNQQCPACTKPCSLAEIAEAFCTIKQPYLMTTPELIATISIISAFTSATLVTYFNYQFGLRTKKLDILYTNRLAAFKEVSKNLVAFKNFCTGKIAYEQGNEFSPFYNEGFGALQHRTEIAKSLESNAIFLSEDSRVIVTDLLNQMSGLCNGEAVLASEPSDLNLVNEYKRMESMSESAIEVLYNELGVSKL